MTSHEIADALLTANAELRAALDVALAENEQRMRVEQELRADYAMLRATARMCFTEDGSEQSMLTLLRLVTDVEHPGVALIIRFNRAKAVVEAARRYNSRGYGIENGTLRAKLDDTIRGYDAALRAKE